MRDALRPRAVGEMHRKYLQAVPEPNLIEDGGKDGGFGDNQQDMLDVRLALVK